MMNQQINSGQLYAGLKLESITEQGQLPQKPPIVLIYGKAGIGVTTLALTCSSNSLLIDCDESAVRSPYRAKETIIFQDYEAIDEAIDGKWFQFARQKFDTIIINGLNELTENLMFPFIERQFPALNDGSKEGVFEKYRLLGVLFKFFMNTLQQAGFTIIITADRAEQKAMVGSDFAIWQPACLGKKPLSVAMNMVDAVGFLHMNQSNQRVLTFKPSASWEAKNPFGLPDINVDQGIEKLGRELLKKHVIQVIQKINRGTMTGSRATILNQYEKSLLDCRDARTLNMLKQQISQLSPDLQFLLSGSIDVAAQVVAAADVTAMDHAPQGQRGTLGAHFERPNEDLPGSLTASPVNTPFFSDPAQCPAPDGSALSEYQAKVIEELCLGENEAMRRWLVATNQGTSHLSANQIEYVAGHAIPIAPDLPDMEAMRQIVRSSRKSFGMRVDVPAGQQSQQGLPDGLKQAANALTEGVNMLANTFGGQVEGLPVGQQANSPQMVQQAISVLTELAVNLEKELPVTMEDVKVWVNIPGINDTFNVNQSMIAAFDQQQWQLILNQVNQSISMIINPDQMQQGGQQPELGVPPAMQDAPDAQDVPPPTDAPPEESTGNFEEDLPF
jgi:hypothetical protein